MCKTILSLCCIRILNNVMQFKFHWAFMVLSSFSFIIWYNFLIWSNFCNNCYNMSNMFFLLHYWDIFIIYQFWAYHTFTHVVSVCSISICSHVLCSDPWVIYDYNEMIILSLNVGDTWDPLLWIYGISLGYVYHLYSALLWILIHVTTTFMYI